MKKRKGFTLIEIIVVIAILAIIAAIAVPTAFGSIENARTAACNAQVDSVLSAYRLTVGNNILNNTAFNAQADIEDALTRCGVAGKTVTASGVNITVSDMCPSTGSAYTGKYDAINHTITLSCAKHGATKAGINPNGSSDADKVTYTYNGTTYTTNFIELIQKIAGGNEVDSSSLSGPISQKINACIANSSIGSAAAVGMTTWHNDNQYFLWTTQSLDDKNVGDPITFIRYNKSTGTYTVWDSVVTTNCYNEKIIKYTSALVTGLVNPDTSKQTYEDAIEAFKQHTGT